MNVLDQVEGQWQKFVALLVWKYAPDMMATITHKDIEQFERLTRDRDPMTLLTHGHKDNIDFRIMRTSAAKRLAEHHEATQGAGRA